MLLIVIVGRLLLDFYQFNQSVFKFKFENKQFLRTFRRKSSNFEVQKKRLLANLSMTMELRKSKSRLKKNVL